MKKLQSKKNLVWIDMEMSGLDPEKERIIEIATLVTDEHLNLLAEGPDLVVHQPLKVLKKMDAWNKEHHQKSGLWDEVVKSKISLKKAEKLTFEFIENYCLPKKNLLCGNAVHHDRRFLAQYMPKIHQFLHYRHIDVSTIKSLVQFWYPKGTKAPEKKTAHRALSDIRESIQELKFYRDHYFKPVKS